MELGPAAPEGQLEIFSESWILPWLTKKILGFFGLLQKNCYKSCLLHSNHLKIGTTHFWTLSKTLTLVM